MPKLSIVIPVYNVQDYLRECIDSVINQTYRDYEIILVDDGSSDMSGKICDEYKEKCDNVDVIHQKNRGHIIARTVGVKVARGKYIGFLDSDDWIEKDMFEKLMAKIEEYDCDLAVCDMYVEGFKQQEKYSQRVAPGFYNEERIKREIHPCMLYLKEKKGFGISPSFVNKVFRKDLILPNMQKVSGEIYVGEDVAAIHMCLLDSKKIYYVNEFLYHYRSVENSVTRRHDEKYFERLEYLSDYLYKISDKKNIYDLTEQINYYRLYLYAQGILSEFVCNEKPSKIIECIKNQKATVKTLLKKCNTKYFEKNVRFVLFFVSKGLTALCFYNYRFYIYLKKRK